MNKELRLEALIAKNIHSFGMRLGQKTHEIISDYLRLLSQYAIQEHHIQQLIDETSNRMRSEFEKSEKKDYTKYDKNNPDGLKEHYFHENNSIDLEQGIQKITDNLRAFIASPLHTQIQWYFKAGHSYYIESKERNFDIMKLYAPELTESEDTMIRAAPDFGIVMDEKNYIIYDRKTGNDAERIPGQISDQLKMYAVKLLHKTNKTIDDITIHCYEVFLPSMQQYGGVITAQDIANITQTIQSDVQELKSLIQEGNGRKNIPLSSQSFTRTTSTAKCRECRLRKVCAKLKKREGDMTDNHILDLLAGEMDIWWLF